MLKQLLRKSLAAWCLLAALPAGAAPDRSLHPVTKQPLLFTENRGQVAGTDGRARPDILFTAHSGSTNIYLTGNSIAYQFTKISYPAGYDPSDPAVAPAERARLEKAVQTRTCRFSLTLEGANLHPEVLREEKSRTEQHFYLAHCPAGITGVSSYQKLIYREVYPHIDWVLYSNGQHLKYDFIVKPGGNPADIRLRVNDAQGTSITKEGELLLQTSLGEIREHAPLSYAGGQPVRSSFRRNEDGTIGFDVAAQPDRELRIDPAVVWSTYYGGTGVDMSYSCVTDAAGNVVIAGTTASTAGIASGGFQNIHGGGNDAFLAKFDTSGYMLWATYYGGAGDDRGLRCVMNGSGDIYMVGQTTTATGLASGGFQNAGGGGVDVLLARFNAGGTRIWSTYYGGSGDDNPVTGFQGIALDGGGNIYIAGSTSSASGIASAGSFMSAYTAGTIAFLTKFDPSGSRVWGTYYPSVSGSACATDGASNVYLTGQTNSTAANIASGGFQNAGGGGTDAYLVKFDGAGNRIWSTFYGSTGVDIGSACVADNSGNVYLGGFSSSASGIASGGFQNANSGGTYDAFLVKFNAATCARIWSSYYGGSGSEQLTHCLLDTGGNLMITGVTASAANIASGGFQNAIGGGNDAFLSIVSPAGALLWGTYYGGTGADFFFGAAQDAKGNIYAAGQTTSAAGVAQPGTYQPAIAGGTDVLLVKIGTPGLFTGTAISTPVCTGSTVSIPFTLFGAYNPGNVFTAQLSNAAGLFTNPVNIGTLAGTAAGTITATIPSVPTGSGYRIRIVSSSPAIIAPNNGANLTINNAAGAATVSITASPGDTVCAGTGVTFTATPVNGGTAPAYQWMKNGAPVGSSSPAYTSPTVSNKDTIYVIMTGNATCATAPDTSNRIIMTVNPAVTPAVSITASPGAAICAGATVTFTAAPINGGAVPRYQWRRNGTALPNDTNQIFTTSGLSPGDVISVRMMSAARCRTADSVFSNNITMTVGASVVPSVSATVAPGSTICAGTNATFTAAPVNGGAPRYQWRKNGTDIPGATASSYTAAGLANGDVISVRMISTAGCRTTDTVYSTGIAMTVNAAVTPAVTLSVSPGDTVCAGTSVTFTAAPVNGGNGPAYLWRKNGAVIPGAGATTSFTTAALSNNDVITVRLTANGSCRSIDTVSSAGVTMTVNPVVSPSVSISASPGNAICSGTNVLFTAAPVNGGASPVYQWQKNGTDIPGANSMTYPAGALANNDVISAYMLSGVVCRNSDSAFSNSIRMTVTPSVTPDITIAASPGSAVCAGTAVTFTATAVNGGAGAVYQWRRNGITVSGAASYASNALSDGDTVTCILGSSLSCVARATDTSNAIIMAVGATVAPTVTIAASPGTSISSGTNVTFTATITNGGSVPVYQWKKNGVNVGGNSPAYSSSTLADNDVITCTVTTSNSCAAPNTGSSNQLTMHVSTGVGQVSGNGSDLRLFPNPNQGAFRLRGTVAAAQTLYIDVVDVAGQAVYHALLPVVNGAVDQQITLKESIAAGAYLLRARTEYGVDVLRFVLTK